MIHFLYLISFSAFVSIVYGAIANGDVREKVITGLKIFGQFTVISLILAWVFYFIPW